MDQQLPQNSFPAVPPPHKDWLSHKHLLAYLIVGTLFVGAVAWIYVLQQSEEIDTTVPVHQVKKEDTSNKKIYHNADIGITFSYPVSLGEPKATAHDFRKTEGRTGQIISIQFPDDKSGTNFYIEAVSSDYDNFYSVGKYTGQEPLTYYCTDNDYSDDGDICAVHNMGSKQVLSENHLFLPECSFLGLTRIVSFENQKTSSPYRGIRFGITLKDVNDKLAKYFDCVDDSKVELLKKYSREESYNITEKVNLSNTDQTTLESFEEIINSVQFDKDL